MQIFRYKAKKGPESIVEGRIEAETREEAVDKISRMGYTPVHIEEYTPVMKSSAAKFTGRIKSRDITIFSRQLSILIKSGVPILNAINIISEQSESVHFKKILRNIHDDIKQGRAFSTALSNYPGVFSKFYIAMVRTGEDSGSLQEILLRIADYRRQQEEILSKIRTALAYPVLMAIVGLGTVVFMLAYVMPRLMQIFISLEQALPLPTRILISLSTRLRQYWFWIVLIILAVVFVFRQQAKTESLKIAISKFKLHMPLFGEFIFKADLARFNRSLELLIKSGMPILRAIDVSVPILKNEVIKRQLLQSYKDLEQGGSFGSSLKKSRIFPAFMTNLIIVGEESGRLDEALAEVSRAYERDIDEAIKVMTSLIEPLMILVIGLLVGFIVVAMLLPIFQINIMAR
ncbi:MAG: type II secretion system F family protein [Candidatus Omnitrophica bacterium]|nr:type II secretion system F family protein [Candidatus Omnitrophota bacterium]MBU1871515.1 type II secretion system F family protein [Candidatus Omnitrophota bacterium]